jgi:hypothetical protein
MRVLHLIDVPSPWGGACTQRLAADVLTRLARPEFGGHRTHDVLIIGQDADIAVASACGLRPVGSIWPLRGRTLSARAALVRWLLAAKAAGLSPHLIHAWTADSGALAALAAPHVPRVVTPRPVAAAIDSSSFVARDEVRERWRRDEGIERDEFVLGLLGEPVECFDARVAMHVGARTGLSSRRIRMIMSGRALGRPESQRFLEQLDVSRAVVQDEAARRPWEIMRGMDAALSIAPAPSRRWHDRTPSSLPVLMAQAAGVPVIVEADAPHGGLVTDEQTGLIFPSGDLNAACLRLARLHDEQSLSQRLIDAARAAVVERYSIDLLCRRLDGAYRRAVEQGRAEYLHIAPAG